MDETFHSSSLVIPYLDTRSMSVKFRCLFILKISFIFIGLRLILYVQMTRRCFLHNQAAGE